MNIRLKTATATTVTGIKLQILKLLNHLTGAKVLKGERILLNAVI
jgi:hypothetical protein